MPRVGGKEFPYTEKGIKAAKKAARAIKKRKTRKTSDGYMME